MRRTIWLALFAAFALTVLTACMSDSDESARGENRAAALVAIGQSGATAQLTIDGVTPAGQAIEVESHSWGGQAPGGTGAAQFRELSITKTMDETSPKLFESLATGRLAPTAVLKLYSTPGGGQPVNYATYTLDRALIVSYSTSGDANDAPREEVTLAYNKIRQETRMPDQNGNQGNPVRFGWDLVARRPW